MNTKTIEVVTLDNNGNEESRVDFETIKEAKSWVKDAALDPVYWDRRAEVAGYAENIHTIQLHVNGEITKDWFPKFKCSH